MTKIQCPHCGRDLQVEAETPLRFCPMCGGPIKSETEVDMGPSELEQRIQKEKKPKKKYQMIQKALEDDPNDFFANRALLFHGRLHESIASGHEVDFSIIKCHLLSVFDTPGKYLPDVLDAKYEELLCGAQLRKTMALAPDAARFFEDYVYTLTADYIDLFIRGDSRNSTLAFGFPRSSDSLARKCAETVNRMLQEIRDTDRLTDTERPLFLRALREGYLRSFGTGEKYLIP